MLVQFLIVRRPWAFRVGVRLVGSDSDDESLSFSDEEFGDSLFGNGNSNGSGMIASPDGCGFKVVMDWTPRTVAASRRVAEARPRSPDSPRTPRPRSPDIESTVLSPMQRESAALVARAAAAAYFRARTEGADAADAASAVYAASEHYGRPHANGLAILAREDSQARVVEDMQALAEATARASARIEQLEASLSPVYGAQAGSNTPTAAPWPGRGVAPEPEPAPSLELQPELELEPQPEPELEPEVEETRSRRSSSASDLSEAGQATSKLIATALFRVATLSGKQVLPGSNDVSVAWRSSSAPDTGDTDQSEHSPDLHRNSSTDDATDVCDRATPEVSQVAASFEPDSPVLAAPGADPAIDTLSTVLAAATPSSLEPVLKACSTTELIQMMEMLSAQNPGQLHVSDLETPPTHDDAAPPRQTPPSNPASVFQRKKRHDTTATRAGGALGIGPGVTAPSEAGTVRSEVSSTRRRTADPEHAARLHDEHQQRIQWKLAKSLEAKRLKEEAEMANCSFGPKPKFSKGRNDGRDKRAVEDRLIEYGRKLREARNPHMDSAGGPLRPAQKSRNFEKRLHDQDTKLRGSARKRREKTAAMQARKKADELASRTVTKKQEINFTHYEEMHKAHHRTQQKLMEKRARIAQEELDAIKQLQKDAGMKVQVTAAGKRGRPRVADLPSTAKRSEIGKVHRQLAESACVKQPGTGAGTTHFLRTSTKDTLYRTAIETALKEERTRSSRGEPRKESTKPRQTRHSPAARMSPAMERLTRPRTPPVSPEELLRRSPRGSSLPTARAVTNTSPAATPKDSPWARTLAAQEKRAMSPILRRSARGVSSKPPASPSLTSTTSVRDFEAAQLWCKRCSAAFAAEFCPKNHNVQDYCALPPSNEISILEGDVVQGWTDQNATASATQQLDAAIRSLAAGPGGQKSTQAVAQQQLSYEETAPGAGLETDSLLTVKPDIHKLAVSALKHAVAADTQYKEAHLSGADSSSLLHATIAAYERAEELLAAVQESDTVKTKIKQALRAKIEPAVARRTRLEKAAETARQRSADYVADAKQALSETEWRAARFAADELAAAEAAEAGGGDANASTDEESVESVEIPGDEKTDDPKEASQSSTNRGMDRGLFPEEIQTRQPEGTLGGNGSHHGVSTVTEQSGPDAKVFSSPPADRTSVSASEKFAALAWVGSVLQRPELEDADLEVLRDGTALCALVNALRPGSIESISDSSMSFHHRVNIQAFISSLAQCGVPEAVGFETADLYENRNPRAVVRCIEALKRAVEAGLVTSASSVSNDMEPQTVAEKVREPDPFADLEAAIAGDSPTHEKDDAEKSVPHGQATDTEEDTEEDTERGSESVQNPMDRDSSDVDENEEGAENATSTHENGDTEKTFTPPEQVAEKGDTNEASESVQSPMDSGSSDADDDDESASKPVRNPVDSGTNAEEEAPSTPAGEDVNDADPFADLAFLVAGGDAQPSSESEQEGQEEEETTGDGDAFGDLAALLG